MDKTQLLNVLYFCSFGIICLTGIIFAVQEYRKWKFPTNTLVWCVVLAIFSTLVYPIVFYAERREMRKRNMDERIAGLKIGIGWFIFFFGAVVNPIFKIIFRNLMEQSYTSDLVYSCSSIAGLFMMISLFWVNAKADRMLGVSRKNPVRQVE